MKVNWCLYFRNNYVVSEIMECDESLITSGSNLTVQMSDDRSILERTKELYKNAKVRIDLVTKQRLKQYVSEGKWLMANELIQEKTGEPMCCNGVIEKFVNEL